MERAVRLLAAKPRAVLELRERLLEKLWTDEEIVDAVIEKLKGYGYLDDAQYALDTATSKLRQKPQGRRRLEQSMSQKKLDREVVSQAISQAFAAHPEEDLLEIAIEKRFRLKGYPQDRAEMRKFIDHLLRQGFPYGMIRDKLSSLLDRLSATDENE